MAHTIPVLSCPPSIQCSSPVQFESRSSRLSPHWGEGRERTAKQRTTTTKRTREKTALERPSDQVQRGRDWIGKTSTAGTYLPGQLAGVNLLPLTIDPSAAGLPKSCFVG